MTKIRIVVRGVILLGIITTAIIGCGGDDVTKSNDDDDNMTIIPKPAEPEADKENEPEAVVEPSPQEPEPESEPVLIGNPRANEPPEPRPEPEPEPPQLDERQLAENAEREARVFLVTQMDSIRLHRLDAQPQPFYDQLYKDEFGFGIFFIMDVLLPILEEEQPEQKERGLFISEPFIVEYTILKFQHPDKNEDELLELFRASARAGNISIIPGEQKPLLNPEQRKIERNQEMCGPPIVGKLLEEFLQTPLPEDPDPNLSNLDKARALWQKYQPIKQELEEQHPNQFANIGKASKEAFGFGVLVWDVIGFTYQHEMGMRLRGGIPGLSLFPLLLEYVRLSFEFPNEDPVGLVCLLRESVRAGNVSAFADNLRPSLEPMMPAPEPPAVEDDVFLEQARALVKEVEAQTDEIIRKMRAEGKGWEEINEAENDIRRREWGFDWDFVETKLLVIHREENPKDVVGDHFVFVSHPLIIEYLRLSLKHPEKEEAELLELFRQSSRDGNISINPDNPKPDIKW